ncbi:class I SAM-dependent methyltransferase [Lentisphaerota bacterium ZTH]|nr:class I SAM-dependent methyltransferase [Lentisphaerota bacterium]WET06551.1 class I SAM-dependent methyltransferase [Lentisphaerota bacterium ZTH]
MNSKHAYWDRFAAEYQQKTQISCKDFHYGPLIPGDKQLGLLPELKSGAKSLELACGAAQNSIYLAGQGVECTALDISVEQLKRAAALADIEKADINFFQLDLEELIPAIGCFDLIHSAYGLNFTAELEKVISCCAEMLTAQGILLFSLPHPLFSAEFLELDGEDGLFLRNYMNIPPEERYDEYGVLIERSFFHGISEISALLDANGLSILRIAEPAACLEPPYTSQVWEQYREQFDKFPSTLIVKAGRT